MFASTLRELEKPAYKARGGDLAQLFTVDQHTTLFLSANRLAFGPIIFLLFGTYHSPGCVWFWSITAWPVEVAAIVLIDNRGTVLGFCLFLFLKVEMLAETM